MTVYLVGAGPGDPGLLTLRAAEVLSQADVVVHDRLVDPAIIDRAPARAERVDVGKKPGSAGALQEEINALLIERGKAGLEVVRLKGGDPFVLGRGGEEALALLDAGVRFEVVPGVTSAVAAPAFAGVPVTHRGLAAAFTVVAGHRRGVDREVDWEALARVGGTIVVLMGATHRAEISRRLLAGGLDPATPVTAVRWGTRPAQRTTRTNLAALPDAPLEAPVTIVVGAVAGLDLGWYERRPLFGRRVVVTRAREQASALVERLWALGADTVEVPAIRVAEPADGGAALRAAAARAGSYDWVVFTSANAVERFLPLLRDARALGRASVASIGPGTAAALARHGIVADLVPERFVAESLLDTFPLPPPGGGRVLLPRAAVARDVLPRGLGERGWHVDVVEAYRTERVEPTEEDRLAVASADAVAFTASSTVSAYLDSMGPDAVPPVVACIGPVTARTARERGLADVVEAHVHTVDGLVDALVEALASFPARG